jgi:hypothetical protein
VIPVWAYLPMAIPALVLARLAWLIAEGVPSQRFVDPIVMKDGTVTDIGWRPFERITYCPWQQSSFGGDCCAHCGKRQDTWRHRRWTESRKDLEAGA